ncbi:MAG: histidine triad nucleotide-binding protein [Kineosporiaceae bacterium]
MSGDTSPGAQPGPPAACVFCRIVSGEIPTDPVLETERVVAFRDIAPKADVHVLVVPRTHHRDVVSLAADDPAGLADLVTAAGRVASDLAPAGHFRLVFNTGEQAGQSVFHVHGHVLAGTGVAMTL